MLVGFHAKPGIKVTTQPDHTKRGNTAILIDVVMGSWTVAALGNNTPTTLVVKNTAGKVVHKGTGQLDDFGFG